VCLELRSSPSNQPALFRLRGASSQLVPERAGVLSSHSRQNTAPPHRTIEHAPHAARQVPPSRLRLLSRMRKRKRSDRTHLNQPKVQRSERNRLVKRIQLRERRKGVMSECMIPSGTICPKTPAMPETSAVGHGIALAMYSGGDRRTFE
jgi:hypothetical protein